MTSPTKHNTNETNEIDDFTLSPNIVSPAVAVDEIENLIERERQPNNNNQHTPIDTKSYRNHSLSLLNHNKQLAYLEAQQQQNTVPRGLLPDIKSTMRLSEVDKSKWQGILQSCGRQLRNLLINHHKEQIIEHQTKRETLKRKIPTQRQHQLNREIKDQYENNKRRKTFNTPQRPQRQQEQVNKTPKN